MALRDALCGLLKKSSVYSLTVATRPWQRTPKNGGIAYLKIMKPENMIRLNYEGTLGETPLWKPRHLNSSKRDILANTIFLQWVCFSVWFFFFLSNYDLLRCFNVKSSAHDVPITRLPAIWTFALSNENWALIQFLQTKLIAWVRLTRIDFWFLADKQTRGS